jgi:hypothetical protein
MGMIFPLAFLLSFYFLFSANCATFTERNHPYSKSSGPVEIDKDAGKIANEMGALSIKFARDLFNTALTERDLKGLTLISDYKVVTHVGYDKTWCTIKVKPDLQDTRRAPRGFYQDIKDWTDEWI